ncbi:ATP-binding protein [Planomonospora sp. ID67723]|uniref:ATP-binding protein n=1 Tax=Planomonospora sp. ID67723 TaxID=2738134 RepID=UPI0018C3C304|nr:ATP-binding protein [Planomonospora sp. ID67723]MBG0827942.1 ATP-binding protein [Planomonospora sp. ID67723]
MDRFIEKASELGKLQRVLAKVEGGRAGRPGRAVLIRGSRRVGKSRLVEEFVRRSGVPCVFYSVARGTPDRQVREFLSAAAASDLPGAPSLAGRSAGSWEEALGIVATAVPQDTPSVIVLDGLPLLLEGDPGLESTLQVAFARELSRRPVMLVLIGSDPAVMEAVNQPGRPFYMRAVEMAVHPLTPADLAAALELPAAEAVDAHLVSGGLPMICARWPRGLGVRQYLRQALADPASALVVTGERILASELAPDAQARAVLNAVGSGLRTHSSIGRAVPEVPRASLNRALQLLVEKRLVSADLPLATRPSRETRYRVAGTHLGFWLSFVGPRLPEIERGRGDLTLARLLRSWAPWRSAAVAPLVRESLRRMEGLPAKAGAIGGYWTRTGDPEIDVVGTDRGPVGERITLVGSITWLEERPFDRRDLSELIVRRSKLPGAGADVPLLAVSRSGTATAEVTLVTPEDLVNAWRPRES